MTLTDISSRLPVQWNNQSDASNSRGSPPPRQRGCDMCGCGHGRKLQQRGDRAPQLASLPSTMDYGETSYGARLEQPLYLLLPPDQFCSAMLANREYLLLFHECQGAVLSSPAPHHDNITHMHTTSLPCQGNPSPLQCVAVTIET